MNINEISSVGWLQNADGSICLTVAVNHRSQPVFVSIPKEEFERVGGIDGIKADKKLCVDFYQKYGTGRSLAKVA